MALRFADVVLTDKPHGVNAACDVVLTHDVVLASERATPTLISNAPKTKRKRKVAKPRAADRHAPGYMAAYMRKLRASGKPNTV